MKITSIFFFIALLSLAGCGDHDIHGNAFVVKGGGDIKPAAGRTVYLVPAQSMDSLLTSAMKNISDKVAKDIEIDKLRRTIMKEPPKDYDIDTLTNKAVVKRAVEIITGDTNRKTETTMNGLFKFNKVPEGQYLLYSDYKDAFVDGFWLAPITVKEDAQFDLNNSTFIDYPINIYLEVTVKSMREK